MIVFSTEEKEPRTISAGMLMLLLYSPSSMYGGHNEYLCDNPDKDTESDKCRKCGKVLHKNNKSIIVKKSGQNAPKIEEEKHEYSGFKTCGCDDKDGKCRKCEGYIFMMKNLK